MKKRSIMQKVFLLGLVSIISFMMIPNSVIANEYPCFRGRITDFSYNHDNGGSITIYNPEIEESTTLNIPPDSLTAETVGIIEAAMEYCWPVKVVYDSCTMTLLELHIYPIITPPGFFYIDDEFEWVEAQLYQPV